MTDCNENSDVSGCGCNVNRRSFLKLTGGGLVALSAAGIPVMAGPFTAKDLEKLVPADKKLSPDWVKSLYERGKPEVYKGENLKYIGMPIGGLCAGQLYLGGDGRLWHWDIFNKHRRTFQENYAKPMKVQSPVQQGFALNIESGGKSERLVLDKTGFPDVTFRGEYPIGIVEYTSGSAPVSVSLEAFSPFIPLSVDDSSLPATVMRFTVKNKSDKPLKTTLFGWLENANCINNKTASGVKSNRIVQGPGYSYLDCFAEKSKSGAEQAQKPDVVFEDWSSETYDGWTAEGTAFGTGPIKKSDIPEYQGDVGGDAERVVNSHASTDQGDASIGKLTSSTFKVEHNYINFWIGGGAHKGKTCLNLLVDGKVVQSSTGNSSNKMTQQSFNVKEWVGKEACLQLVDDEVGGWGNIGLGRITFSNRSVAAEVDLEKLEDFGSMGLALLGDKADYAAAADGAKGPSPAAVAIASTSLAESLVGGLGRKLEIAAGESEVVTFVVAWNFPNLKNPDKGRYYATRFANAESVVGYIAKNRDKFYSQTKLWRDTWYDSSLPYWFLDRTFANASILATSTSFRFADGRFWGWEGVGCCSGTCTHVWHYEQTMGRIFPELDIALREKTDLNPKIGFHSNGSLGFRDHGGFAIDGQSGIILRCLRDHQVSPDDSFLKKNWANIKKALEYLIEQDIDADGILDKNQHNTLDAEWYGKVAWLSGLYLAAVRAGEEMALDMGDKDFAKKCRKIAELGKKNLVDQTWNGEYFYHVGDPEHAKSVGSYDGCEIDQVLGQSWAYQVGLGEVLPQKETRTALRSLWKYNFAPDVGPYREAYKAGRWYAMPGEAGLLMCSWPKGDSKRVTTGYDYYFNECMNGFEYQVAGHMIWENMLKEGLAITRAIHDRYDGSKRNPWNEIECGDHYARSMASYGVFLAACGFEYHGPKKHIGFAPRLAPEDFRSAFTAAEGWGSYGQKYAKGRLTAEISVKYGQLAVKTVALSLPEARKPAKIKLTLDGQSMENSFSVKDGRLLITLAKDIIVGAGHKIEITA